VGRELGVARLGDVLYGRMLSPGSLAAIIDFDAMSNHERNLIFLSAAYFQRTITREWLERYAWTACERSVISKKLAFSASIVSLL